jgi:hypothetical protein
MGIDQAGHDDTVRGVKDAGSFERRPLLRGGQDTRNPVSLNQKGGVLKRFFPFHQGEKRAVFYDQVRLQHQCASISSNALGWQCSEERKLLNSKGRVKYLKFA